MIVKVVFPAVGEVKVELDPPPDRFPMVQLPELTRLKFPLLPRTILVAADVFGVLSSSSRPASTVAVPAYSLEVTPPSRKLLLPVFVKFPERVTKLPMVKKPPPLTLIIAFGESVIVLFALAERKTPLGPVAVRPWTAKSSATVIVVVADEFDVLNWVTEELPPPSENHVSVSLVPLALVVQIVVLFEVHVGGEAV